MTKSNLFDAIIIGGSYAGLSAAMALGRSLRQVLVIDSGKPCNRQTPHSHNFLTQDGATPAAIAQKAREQVLQYSTVTLLPDTAVSAQGQNNAFAVETASGATFLGSKLLFATGIADVMPVLPGFAECWGISVLHCPYCHGYEVSHQPLGILANGDLAYEMAKLISNWSSHLTVLTNGKPAFTPAQAQSLQTHHIIMETREIAELVHTQGQLQSVLFQDGTTLPLSALFARPAFAPHCMIPQEMGCELTDQGYLKVDDFQRTSLPGVFAAGDATTMFRAVAVATAAGTKAGAALNKELIEERF